MNWAVSSCPECCLTHPRVRKPWFLEMDLTQGRILMAKSPWYSLANVPANVLNDNMIILFIMQKYLCFNHQLDINPSINHHQPSSILQNSVPVFPLRLYAIIQPLMLSYSTVTTIPIESLKNTIKINQVGE